jgi:hypothetical protein
MAKFKDLSLDLETGEHIDFDDDDTIMMGYDGDELYLNSTLSGVRAAQPYHMVRYDQLTQASGILVNYIDEGLEAQDEFIELLDTPSSYAGANNYDVVVNGSELVFKNDRVLTDGSRGFTSTISGVDPVEGYDLVTLQYLESLIDPTASGSVGNILFGSEFDYVIDETVSSTNSTSYQHKLDLDVDISATGGYRVGWHFEWRMSKQNENFYYRVRLDGSTNLIETNKSPFVDVNEWQGITNFYYLPTLASGSHTIDIDYHSSNTGATAYIRSTRIEFWRVI